MNTFRLGWWERAVIRAGGSVSQFAVHNEETDSLQAARRIVRAQENCDIRKLAADVRAQRMAKRIAA